MTVTDARSSVELDGQTAIVTGAAGGIGMAISDVLARHGANVVASDVDSERLSETRELLNKHETDFLTVECDVTDPESVEALRDSALKFGDSLDILVTSHGIINRGEIGEESLTDWARVIDVNLTGVFIVSKHIFSEMVDQGSGCIVNIGSVVGHNGSPPASAAYCASKGGIHTFTKNLAHQGAEQGVRVNAIAPGFIKTPLTETGEGQSPGGIPLNRLGEPTDIAEGVLYLVSPHSSWVTGQVLDINGGSYLR